MILGAIAVSVMAVSAIGYVPWGHDDSAPARPAQIQALTRVDTSTPGSEQWAELRGKAQGALDQLTGRDSGKARDAIDQLSASWRAGKPQLQANLPDQGERLDKAVARASQRLSAPKPELLLSKAAVLDVLSALDTAAAATRAKAEAAAAGSTGDAKAGASNRAN